MPKKPKAERKTPSKTETSPDDTATDRPTTSVPAVSLAMAKFTHTSDTEEYSITSGTFYVTVTDDRRSTSQKTVRVTIEFELRETEGSPEFEYVSCNAPSNKVTQREIQIIDGVVTRLEDKGLTVRGAPTLS